MRKVKARVKSRVPFNIPFQTGSEIQTIKRVLALNHLSGDGFFTSRCSSFLEKFLDVPRVLLTPSCTQALEMSFILLNVQPGDEIIVPSFTFPSTVNAFVLRGGHPRFVDIRPDTLNLDESKIDEAIGKNTKVIVPVHYAGVPCEMDSIIQTARRHGVAIVEDAAQALGAEYRGKKCGTFGILNAFSFHETKNITCGEGGALSIVGKRYARRAEIIRQKGTDRAKFYRGEVRKYSWMDIGSSYVPSELQMAFLLSQLEKINGIQARRRALHDGYMAGLDELKQRGNLQLPYVPSHVKSSHHLFYVIFSSEKWRTRTMERLKNKGINTVFHYFPLHLSKMGKAFGYRQGALPVTEKLAGRILRLPMFNSMTERDQNAVIKALFKVL